MHVLTFGSTGLIGRYILVELLKHGYHVTVGCIRNRERLLSMLATHNYDHSLLSIVEGNVLDKEDVERSFASCSSFDAVISTIGEKPDCIGKVQSHGARLLFDAFKKFVKNVDCYFVLFAGSPILDVCEDANGLSKLFLHSKVLPDLWRPSGDEYLRVFDMVCSDYKEITWCLVCPPMVADKAADGVYEVARNVHPPSPG
ncbi:unnamed protein product [Rotaria magnacalcarata]|uniref:NAD(P)-binding domain-containing protein n=1 Tax=Rotaria magnacalcarata TaxID=392030 RepID=A0A820LTG9_9BILA|nr:unnamed protein product [Rotaria magnacalcarata]CAF2105081.1 unnamed protein product [Rotaria magnacalcarata]CAF4310183.1 unnamed protein product [Rotaria magnacalcarata]CAF4361860.1 unnamed protein product [Rotaria magnacalcarata]